MASKCPSLVKPDTFVAKTMLPKPMEKLKKSLKKKKKPFEGIGESPRQKVACAQRDNL